MSSLVPRALRAVLILTLLLPAAPALAQMGEAPKNLQVLPKDIARPELIKIMRGFATSLGVRCDFCHVEPPGPRGPGSPPQDFASDDKAEKKTARVMMKMVAAINGDYLTKMEGEEHEGHHAQVACETCHRGQKEPPKPLAIAMTDTVGTKGVDAAFDQYADLKTKSGDAGLYDFRDTTLLRVARSLSDDKQADAALSVLKRSKALFPQSSDVAAALGSALVQSGDATQGKAELERALKLDPENRGAKFALDRLNNPQPPPPQAPPK